MDVDKIKRSYNAYKGHLTRATQNSEELRKATSVDVVEMERTITKLELRWTQFDETFNKLELLLLEEKNAESEVDNLQTEYYQYERNYQQNVAALRTTVKSQTPANTQTTVQSNTSVVRPKLPDIQLPIFSGDLTEYESFMDQFQAQIGGRVDLEPVTKLQYLKSQVKGRPFDLIKGYTSASANYQCALDTLKDTYGDDDKIKHCLLHKILNLESPKHNRCELENFRIALFNLTKSLSNKHNYDCCEWIISSIFQHKLSTTTIRQLYLKYEVNFFTLDQLNEGLRDLISHMEIENPQKKGSKQDTTSSVAEYKEKPIGTYYSTEANKIVDYKCRFCRALHKEAQCTKYPSGYDRLQRLKELKLCTRCMGTHDTRACAVKLQACRRCNKGLHHTSLCRSFDVKPSTGTTPKKNNVTTPEDRPQTNPGSQQTTSVRHVNPTTTQSTGVALATAPAILENKRENRVVRLFFDNGSQKTLILRKVVQETGLTITTTKNITLKGFMATPKAQDYQIVRPVIRMGNRRKKITAVVVDELPDDITARGLSAAVKKLTTQGIKLADPNVNSDRVEPVDLLIGGDFYYDFIYPQVIMHEGIHLLQSPSGCIIQGKIPETGTPEQDDITVVSSESVFVLKITHQEEPIMTDTLTEEPEVHKLWDLDSIGIDASQPLPEERKSYQVYLDTVNYDSGQYWVNLPWKINSPELPNNYGRALGQMYSLVTDLVRKDKVDTYDNIIKEQLELGFIEEVHRAKPSEQSHYLPHHAVSKDSETTPIRIVFNCSSKANSQTPSLNDCLMTGPSLTKKLYDVLLNFRTNKHAFTADISKAFLRIGLKEEDRDYTRFLWPSNPKDPNSALKTYRFKSVLFGATSSPFLLQATIDYHLKHSTSPIKEILSSNFYVDNFQGSVNDEHTLMNIYQESNKELQLANMPLRQWNTNNTHLKDRIKTDFPGQDMQQKTSVLGLQWDTQDDTLTVKPIKGRSSHEKSLTKRILLANISKIFDPLGIFSPITIKGKLLMQESWCMKVGWDDALPVHYVEQWKKLEDEYRQLAEMKVERVTADESEASELHVFCDASGKAYGACAYLVTTTKSTLLTSKARVAPIKTRTIPQLELTSLLIGTRLALHVLQTLHHLTITNVYVWSDNEAALQWVKKDSSKLPYVKNRVTEINELQNNFIFMHVNTKSNPADYLSRGVKLNQLDSLWFRGPEWLRDHNQWPTQKTYVVSSVIEPQVEPKISTTQVEPLIDHTKYSSLRKLLRVTSNVFKFVNIILMKMNSSRRLKHDCATRYWVKHVQREVYKDELGLLQHLSINNSDSDHGSESSKGTLGSMTLSTNSNTDFESSKKTLGVGLTQQTKSSTKILKSNKLVHDLGLFLDEKEIIRCGGRLHHSSLSYATKYPVLLPKEHTFTQLVIREAHITTLHGGVADTLINIRENYWIPKARQQIKKIVGKCTTCRRYDARRIKYPGPPPIPEERIRQARPFQVVGVDYTGAIYLRKPKEPEESDPAKVYICLFTCATTRAVHLELATDMTTNTFIRAFRRFVGRRSCPRIIISDNGSNFRATESFFKSFFQHPDVQQYFDDRHCKWKFIPPKAPWQGGFYERMVGTVKRCLRKVLHNKCINEDELRTVLTEIEARINNRPLTYIHENIDEPEALTPNHLLQGDLIKPIPPVMDKESMNDPDFLCKLDKPSAKDLTARFNYINKLLKSWNKTWHNDYLTSLREYHYGVSRNHTTPKLKQGDIVLIDCDTPRATWPIGIITSLLPDKNGVLRIVKILCKGKESLRTIDKLVPLEVSKDIETPSSEEEGDTIGQRPQREAAIRARNRLHKQITGECE